MKISFTAAATLAAISCAASAQSTMTVFGTVDLTVAIGRGSLSNMARLANSGLSSSAIGFRGVEDLGSGMSASFWLEAAISPDDGTGSATNINNQTTGAGS